MNTNRTSFGIACRVAAFCFLVAGTASLLQAQQSSSDTSASRAPLFVAAESAPLNLSATSSSSSSSSSSPDASADDHFNLSLSALDSSQPPPRRRYGRPNYSSGASNYFGFVGFGAAVPVGNTHKYETESWGLQFGVGRNFGKNFGVPLEFDYDHFGLQGATINNWAYLYSISPIVGGCTPAEFYAGSCVTGQDGNSHIWSFTLDPTYTLSTSGSLGAYFVVGGGFYHKITNFTIPQIQESCYYYCQQYQANANLDHYVSNAFGVNGGIGLTWKFSQFSGERLYVEAKYVLMLNPQRYGLTEADSTSAPYGSPSNPGGTYTGTDIYPQNSNRTTYIPIKVGIRF